MPDLPGEPIGTSVRQAGGNLLAVVRRSQRYDDALVAVHEVVNAADPIGLLDGGAPDDEYDPEVGDLVRMVLSKEDFDENQVDAVWRRWFGDDYTMLGTPLMADLTKSLQAVQRRFMT